MIAEYLFPVCNHNGITECNVGYACGCTDNNTYMPFEMEVVRTDAFDKICIVLPRRIFKCVPDPLDYEYIYADPVKDDGPRDYYDILVRGMQYDGKVENTQYISRWIEELEMNRLITFLGERKDICIDAFTDLHGTSLVRIAITLREEQEILAEWNEDVYPFVKVKNGGFYTMFEPDYVEE